VSVNNSASQELISKCGSRSMPTVVIGARWWLDSTPTVSSSLPN